MIGFGTDQGTYREVSPVLPTSEDYGNVVRAGPGGSYKDPQSPLQPERSPGLRKRNQLRFGVTMYVQRDLHLTPLVEQEDDDQPLIDVEKN